MESEEVQTTQTETLPRVDKWYTPLTRVTPLSKVLAAVLFAVLPFVGFWLGTQYSDKNYVDVASYIAPVDIVVQDPASLEALKRTDSRVSTSSSVTMSTYTFEADDLTIDVPQGWEVRGYTLVPVGGADEGGITVGVYPNPAQEELFEYPYSPHDPFANVRFPKDTVVNGHPATILVNDAGQYIYLIKLDTIIVEITDVKRAHQNDGVFLNVVQSVRERKWSAYENVKDEYSIEYPASWKLEETGNGVRLQPDINEQTLTGIDDPRNMFISIDIEERTSKSVEEWCKNTDDCELVTSVRGVVAKSRDPEAIGSWLSTYLAFGTERVIVFTYQDLYPEWLEVYGRIIGSFLTPPGD